MLCVKTGHGPSARTLPRVFPIRFAAGQQNVAFLNSVFWVGLSMSVNSASASDYTPQLKQLMQQVGLNSFAALSRATGLSRRQISGLRQGKIQELRLRQALQLSRTLEITLSVLVATFASAESVELLRRDERNRSIEDTSLHAQQKSITQPVDLQQMRLQQALESLKQEYQHLHTQLQDQQIHLWQEYQRSTLQVLESLLLQWPTVAYAARKNPEAPAIKILPLLQPLDQLLASWGIVPIGEVGTEIAYDPQWHQLMPTAGQATVLGDQVRVRYVGYRQGEQLLYRAKVSSI